MAGTAKLVGTDPDQILETAAELLSNPDAYQEMANAVNPFGDGYASDRILQIVKAYFQS